MSRLKVIIKGMAVSARVTDKAEARGAVAEPHAVPMVSN